MKLFPLTKGVSEYCIVVILIHCTCLCCPPTAIQSSARYSGGQHFLYRCGYTLYHCSSLHCLHCRLTPTQSYQTCTVSTVYYFYIMLITKLLYICVKQNIIKNCSMTKSVLITARWTISVQYWTVSNTVHYSTVKFSTLLYSKVQELCCTILYCTVQSNVQPVDVFHAT